LLDQGDTVKVVAPEFIFFNFLRYKFISQGYLFDAGKGFLYQDKLAVKADVSMLASVMATAGVIPSPPSTLATDLASIQNDSSFSDVLIKTKGKSFRAHRIILAARSPVFKAMFSHNMQESRNNEVVVKDVEPEVMEELLRYIYTNKVNGINAIAKALLAAADKYALDSLKTVCESALISELTVDDVADVLVLSDMHGCNHLKEAALTTIRRFPEKIVKTAGWTKLIQSFPSLVSEIITSQQRASGSTIALADSLTDEGEVVIIG